MQSTQARGDGATELAPRTMVEDACVSEKEEAEGKTGWLRGRRREEGKTSYGRKRQQQKHREGTLDKTRCKGVDRRGGRATRQVNEEHKFVCV